MDEKEIWNQRTIADAIDLHFHDIIYRSFGDDVINIVKEYIKKCGFYLSVIGDEGIFITILLDDENLVELDFNEGLRGYIQSAKKDNDIESLEELKIFFNKCLEALGLKEV